MTERLKELLAAEADGLDIPPPAAHDLLVRGKGVRRRRRFAVGAGVLATAAIVGGGATLTLGAGTGSAPDPASVPRSMVGPVFTVGATLYYGEELDKAVVDDAAVKSLLYTSAGVVVRHGDNSASDGGGPQRFSLVTPDGTVSRLGLVTEEAVHATDSDEQHVVYAETRAGQLEVVVYDVVADAVVQRIAVAETRESWFPVSLDGDTVFVQNGHDGKVHTVDWRSGVVADSDHVSTVWNMAGGRVGLTSGEEPVVIDVRTGEVLLTGTGGPSASFEVSPDGRYAALTDGNSLMAQEPAEFAVYDIDTGSSHTFEGYPYDWGWTADGDLFQVGVDVVTTCDTATGACTETSVELEGAGSAAPDVPCSLDGGTGETVCDGPEAPPPPEIRLGGRTYES